MINDIHEMQPDEKIREGVALVFEGLSEIMQNIASAFNKFYHECSRYFGGDSRANARYMIAKYASLAPCAALLRNDIEFSHLIEKEMANNPAVTVAALAVDGNTLLSLGIEAKSLGKIMEKLLIDVIKEPSINNCECLCSLALSYADKI